MNPFPYSLDNKRYHTLNYHLKTRFGGKVCKVPLTLGTTCPNRDGTKGIGGCSFCSAEGGGGTITQPSLSLSQEFAQAVVPLWKKWPDALTIPYFQNYTNTYLPLERFQQAAEKALTLPHAVGLSVATRPDAIAPEYLDYLEDLSTRTYLTVELGLQTIHPQTALRLNRGHSWQEFVTCYSQLANRAIPVCLHLINGLPGEDAEDMLATVRAIAPLRPQGVKIHMLHLVKGTTLAQEYEENPFPLLSREEYVEILADQLELLPPETVIERITGDPIAGELLAPQWTLNKLWVRNALDKELATRNSWQGKLFLP